MTPLHSTPILHSMTQLNELRSVFEKSGLGTDKVLKLIYAKFYQTNDFCLHRKATLKKFQQKTTHVQSLNG